MWDVKLLVDMSVTSDVNSFYLNYVGCKVLTQGYKLSASESFTLTMWDVKEELAEILEKSKESFTLTMWDVKEKP